MSGLRSTNSVVIIDPAESSGYLSISFISALVCGSAWCRIRLTILAGISSMISTASSIYSSSTIALSSLSEKARISSSCIWLSISTKVSDARSFGSSRKSLARRSSSISLKPAAMSEGFIVVSRSLSELYFFCSRSFSKLV